jgi:hypothetical protein
MAVSDSQGTVLTTRGRNKRPVDIAVFADRNGRDQHTTQQIRDPAASPITLL